MERGRSALEHGPASLQAVQDCGKPYSLHLASLCCTVLEARLEQALRPLHMREVMLSQIGTCQTACYAAKREEQKQDSLVKGAALAVRRPQSARSALPRACPYLDVSSRCAP